VFYESPLELLEDTKREIEKDIAWYENPNTPGISYTLEYRQARIRELKDQLTAYEKAISRLKEIFI